MTAAARTFRDDELNVLALLNAKTYDQVSNETGWSRGRIYALAKRAEARKTESRIRERQADRARRQMETLQEILNETITANVTDYLESLPDGCAQLVLTSIPYNIGKTYGDAPDSDRMRHVYWLGWMIQILSEFARVIKDGGVLFLQVGATRNEHDQLVPIDVLLFDWLQKAGLTYQSRIAWIIPHGLTPKKRVSERYEVALVFTKGEPAVFNPTPGRTPQKQPDKRAFKGPNKGELSGSPFGAWPSNVWTDVGHIANNHPEKTGHPAQFPLALATKAIQMYSMPGDLVIDPFSGSGTTQVAARQTGRNFSGSDLFYEDIRTQRLEGVALASESPLPGVTDASVAVWRATARRVDIPAPVPPDLFNVAS